MAHLIDMSNDRANMAYVGETPWHGLGSTLPAGADIDQWRVAAGLDWRVGRSQVLFRDDTFAQLGIVSDRYQIVQPAEVLEFFRDIVGAGNMELETAGSLDGGRKVWALAKTGHEFAIRGQDRINGYLLLSTSFDGSMATRAQFTSVRVVCNNTLQIAHKDTVGAIKIPHSTEFNAEGVKIDLGILGNAFSHFEEDATVLAGRRLTDKEAMALLASVLVNEPVTDVTELSARKFNQIKSVYDLYAYAGKGAGLASSKGTAWGLVIDKLGHGVHQAGRNINNRFRSGQFGQGAAMKASVFNQALALVA